MSTAEDQIKTSGRSLQKTQGQGWGTHATSFDPEYTPGARNAVNVCLRVQPEEKVCVITDEVTLEIAAAIAHELENVGAPFNVWVLEDLAPRPLKNLPQEIIDDLETSQVSIFAVQA